MCKDPEINKNGKVGNGQGGQLALCWEFELQWKRTSKYCHALDAILATY